MERLLAFLPFGYAFGAGMVTMVSPCSVAMLPSYVSMYLGHEDDARRRLVRAGRAVLFALLSTAGFVALSAAVGGVIATGGQFVMRLTPWAAVFVGVALLGIGIWMLAGGHVAIAAFSQVAGRTRLAGRRPSVRFLLFGIVYAVAALSCTLPVFLVVVGGAFAAGGVARGVMQFISYSLGMGTVMVIIGLGAVLFDEALRRWLRRWTPLVSRLSGLLLVASGGYLLYYWFGAGDLLGLTGR